MAEELNFAPRDVGPNRVQSSSIARTVPFSVGDADRAVTAVIAEGWTPPEGYAITEDGDDDRVDLD
jgi:hypothetical protein